MPPWPSFSHGLKERSSTMGKLKTYHQNDVIFCQGDESKSMFIVRKGRVGVILDRGSDHESFLAELLSGQFLGELGMIER